MAEQQVTQEASVGNGTSNGGVTGKLLIAGFMGGVVGLECLLAYLMFPSPEEVAALLGVSVPTVVRRWRLARAWLYRYLSGEDAHGH